MKKVPCKAPHGVFHITTCKALGDICFISLAVYKNDDLKFIVVQQRAPLVKVNI